MFKLAINQLKTAFSLFLVLTVITGILYPLALTGLAQLFFPKQANGSLIKQGNKIVGSFLIGQWFKDSGYFWGRPSVTSPFPYNGANSSGSNMGPSNPVFINRVNERVVAFRQYEINTKSLIPVDLVTASGSGLDAEISPLAAYYQVPRIAKARQISEKDMEQLIQRHIINRTLGILGEPRVNVLQLNLALNQLGYRHD